MYKPTANKEEEVCVVVNNELVCVNSHKQSDYEMKRFEKKLNRASKQMEKDVHHDLNHFVNNGFVCVSTD